MKRDLKSVSSAQRQRRVRGKGKGCLEVEGECQLGKKRMAVCRVQVPVYEVKYQHQQHTPTNTAKEWKVRPAEGEKGKKRKERTTSEEGSDEVQQISEKEEECFQVPKRQEAMGTTGGYPSEFSRPVDPGELTVSHVHPVDKVTRRRRNSWGSLGLAAAIPSRDSYPKGGCLRDQ